MNYQVEVQENKQRIIGYMLNAKSFDDALKLLNEHYKYCLEYGILHEYEIVAITKQDISDEYHKVWKENKKNAD